MIWLWAVVACQPGEELSEPTPVCAADSPAYGEVSVFASGFEEDGTAGSEGVIFSPEGRLFVGGAAYGGGGGVWEVLPSGETVRLADLPGSVGLAWWNDQLVVAVGKDGAAGELGGVVSVGVDSGTVTVLTTEVEGANFPLATPWGSLLVSSPGTHTIWELDTSAEVRPWLTDIPSPNGLALSHDGTTLYVAQSYDEPLWLRRVDVDPDGRAGAVHDFAQGAAGDTQDGLAIDSKGGVYVVLNLPGEIEHVTPAGVKRRIARDVAFGASLDFGVSPFDPCSLYVTSLFTDELFRVGTAPDGRVE